jgi:hypothetical protein
MDVVTGLQCRRDLAGDECLRRERKAAGNDQLLHAHPAPLFAPAEL